MEQIIKHLRPNFLMVKQFPENSCKNLWCCVLSIIEIEDLVNVINEKYPHRDTVIYCLKIKDVNMNCEIYYFAEKTRNVNDKVPIPVIN